MGLMLGASMDGPAAGDVVVKCIEKGLLILTAKTKLRFLPPLIITYEEIDQGIQILGEVLSEIK